MTFEHIKEHQDVLDARENSILVTGRPGRGKTTLALLLAERIIQEQQIDASQQVLFLTFSRNAVYQIEQASGHLLAPHTRNRLWIATYHSFMWWLISAFGRFHGLPRKLEVMGETKSRAARTVANLANVKRDQQALFLAQTFSAISYDDFAPLVLALLSNSGNLCEIIRYRFPVLIVDEFQDTSQEQWELIKIIAAGSRLVCFADQDQMIYRWRGASINRLDQFCRECQVRKYPLQQKCLRTDKRDLLDFAEALLDDNPGSPRERVSRKRQFLQHYPGHSALGYYLKTILAEFYRDYWKTNPRTCSPTIALAAYSNAGAKSIQVALAKSTQGKPKTYRSSILQGATDSFLDELLIHLATYAAGNNREELEQALQIVGSMLTTDVSKASGPVASLFTPKDLLDGRVQCRMTAKYVVEAFQSVSPLPIAVGSEAITGAVEAITMLRGSVKAVCNAIAEEDLKARHTEMLRIIGGAPTGSALVEVQYLRDKLVAERLRRDVLERVRPVRGIVSSTLHKLKGREFDYVCVVAHSGEKLHNQRETEADARRLMYVALTRARYDARILYVQSNPCFLVSPYL